MDTVEDKPRKKTPREMAFALLPTLLTLGNAVCGFGAITILARVGPSLDMLPGDLASQIDPASQMVKAALLIFLAMLFDALDGSAARLTNQSSEFGAMLDSLCDVVSFGVAPAFMMLKLTDPQYHLMETPYQPPFYYSIDFLWTIATLYMACAILRLARFNVETDDDDSHEGFSGLPSPAAAGVIAGFPIGVMTLKKLLTQSTATGVVAEVTGTAPSADPAVQVSRGTPWAEPLAEILLPTLAVLLPFITLATAVLMVSRIRYPHVFNQILRGNRGRLQLLQLVFTLALVFQVKGMAIPVIFCWFAFAGPVNAIWRRYIVRRLPFRGAAL
ncbi:MAG: CDP-alcohol phosphatidyltransferase family protein [Planctomycetaceae bacterium]